MEPARRAIIDVGTNSIKLLVAEVAGDDVRPLVEQSKQTRLGRGFYESRRLQTEAIATTARAVARFGEIARQEQASSIRVIATSAARDALNAQELTSAIEKASGLKVEILSGEQEADWVFKGVTTDARLAGKPLVILDVGGGSTELILGRGIHKHFSQSFPLGTVRLMENIPHSDPPKEQELQSSRQWVIEFLQREVRPKLEPAMARLIGQNGYLHSASELRSGGRKSNPVWLVGTGGTTSILGRMEAQLEAYDRARIEATRLTLERVRWHARRLWSLPLEQRKQIVGLPKNRADVILTGVIIYEAVMEQFGFAELRISTRGLRFAAIIADSGMTICPASPGRK